MKHNGKLYVAFAKLLERLKVIIFVRLPKLNSVKEVKPYQAQSKNAAC